MAFRAVFIYQPAKCLIMCCAAPLFPRFAPYIFLTRNPQYGYGIGFDFYLCRHHITPHHTRLCHVVSYHVISYHIRSDQIISYHFMSFQIILFHPPTTRIISDDIFALFYDHVASSSIHQVNASLAHQTLKTSCRIISFHIISYNIISSKHQIPTMSPHHHAITSSNPHIAKSSSASSSSNHY